MGNGKCTSSVTKTKTYEEKGNETVTKTVTTKCHCNKYVSNYTSNGSGTKYHYQSSCGNCWHSYDIHN